jgi:putative oxidoreductase
VPTSLVVETPNEVFHLAPFADYALLFLRIMAGAIYVDSGYNDLRDRDARSKSIGMPKGFTIFLAVAELAGGVALILGVLQQLAAIGLVLVMLGAIQKKMFVWETGFWGKDGLGWSYDLTLISMLLVILSTDGGRFVLLP